MGRPHAATFTAQDWLDEKANEGNRRVSAPGPEPMEILDSQSPWRCLLPAHPDAAGGDCFRGLFGGAWSLRPGPGVYRPTMFLSCLRRTSGPTFRSPRIPAKAPILCAYDCDYRLPLRVLKGSAGCADQWVSTPPPALVQVHIRGHSAWMPWQRCSNMEWAGETGLTHIRKPLVQVRGLLNSFGTRLCHETLILDIQARGEISRCGRRLRHWQIRIAARPSSSAPARTPAGVRWGPTGTQHARNASQL